MTENFCIFSSIFLAIPHKIYRFAPILKRIHTHLVPQPPVKTDKIEKNATSNTHPKRNGTWVSPFRPSTNILPLLSGSGESENVRISLAECGSQQPEFVARNTAALKICTKKKQGAKIPLLKVLEGS